MRRLEWMDGSLKRQYAVCVDVTVDHGGRTMIQPQRIASFVEKDDALYFASMHHDDTAAVYRSGHRVTA